MAGGLRNTYTVLVGNHKRPLEDLRVGTYGRKILKWTYKIVFVIVDWILLRIRPNGGVLFTW